MALDTEQFELPGVNSEVAERFRFVEQGPELVLSLVVDAVMGTISRTDGQPTDETQLYAALSGVAGAAKEFGTDQGNPDRAALVAFAGMVLGPLGYELKFKGNSDNGQPATD